MHHLRAVRQGIGDEEGEICWLIQMMGIGAIYRRPTTIWDADYKILSVCSKI